MIFSERYFRAAFCFFLIFAALLISIPSVALDFKASGSYRNLPSGKTLELELKDEYLLWDQRSEDSVWKFGFIQPRVLLGAHGHIEAGLNLVPIGPVEIGYTQSVTHRFYDTSLFTCGEVLCRGILKRQKWQLRLGLAYQDFFAIPSYSVTETRSDDKSKSVVDQEEGLLLIPGGDDMQTYGLMMGIKKDNDDKSQSEAYGLFLRQVDYKDSDVHSEAQYLFYRKEFKPWAAAAGLGRFASTFSKPGFSIYVNVEWLWGNSSALF